MSKNITFQYDKAKDFIGQEEINNVAAQISAAHKTINDKSGAGNDFLGWVDLPVDYDKEEFDRIKKAAAKIRKDSDVLVVIGIGGSYLGAKAAIDFVTGPFYNYTAKPQIIFAGNNISPNYLNSVIECLDGKDVSLNVIQRQNRPLPSVFSKNTSRISMERKRQRAESMRPPTRQRARLKTSPIPKAMKHLLFRTMSAEDSLFSPLWVFFLSRYAVLTSRQ